MQIHYELKFKDYFIFVLFHQIRSPITQIVMGLPALLPLIYPPENTSTFAQVLMALALYLFIWTVQILFLLIYLRNKNNKFLLTKYKSSVTADSLYISTKYAENRYFSGGIATVKKFPKIHAIYINGSAAQLIPNQCFSSKEEMNTFFQNVNFLIESQNEKK